MVRGDSLDPLALPFAALAGLGARIAEHRLNRRMTQEELAQRAGLSKRTIERIEKAEPGLRLSAFVAVCQVLGLTSGFDALVPAIELGPLALAKGKRLPRRVRKPSRTANVKWGDGT